MILGLTGGIGSGKSTVARVLEILGAAVFNSDLSAKLAYFDPTVRIKVIELLGPESYISDHEINKRYISEQIFNHTELLAQLNALIHPFVKNEMANFVKANKGKMIVKESALLYETGLDQTVDEVIVVTAPESLRIERTMKRDALSKEQVLKKMQAQLPQSLKEKKAKYLLVNDEQQLLLPQILDLVKLIQS